VTDDRMERRAAAQARRVRARLDYEMRTAFPGETVRQQIIDVIAPTVDDELRDKDEELARAKREAAEAKAALHWLRLRARSAIYACRHEEPVLPEPLKSIEEALDDPRSVSAREIHFDTCVIDYPDNQVKARNWGSHPEHDYNEIDYTTPEVSRCGGNGRIVMASCFDRELCREAFEAARDEAQRQLAALPHDRSET
jgi:hypothetical protein